MARTRDARPERRTKTDPVMAEWERELLGFNNAPLRAIRAARNQLRAGALISSSRSGKPKTAEAAARRARQAELHRQSGITSSGKPRKSRRELKRKLYGPESD